MSSLPTLRTRYLTHGNTGQVIIDYSLAGLLAEVFNTVPSLPPITAPQPSKAIPKMRVIKLRLPMSLYVKHKAHLAISPLLFPVSK